MVPTAPPLVVVMTREVRERCSSCSSRPRREDTPERVAIQGALTELPPGEGGREGGSEGGNEGGREGGREGGGREGVRE